MRVVGCQLASRRKLGRSWTKAQRALLTHGTYKNAALCNSTPAEPRACKASPQVGGALISHEPTLASGLPHQHTPACLKKVLPP